MLQVSFEGKNCNYFPLGFQDEAHRLRNVNSKLLECMRSVVTKGQIAYGYQHRILMTGTPLQNNTVELWSLLNFIEPAKFPDLEKFQERFGHIQTQEQVRRTNLKTVKTLYSNFRNLLFRLRISNVVSRLICCGELRRTWRRTFLRRPKPSSTWSSPPCRSSTIEPSLNETMAS